MSDPLSTTLSNLYKTRGASLSMSQILAICSCADGSTSDSDRAQQCKTCNAIDKVGKKRWCFEWLRHLKDYGSCLETEKAERDRQVRLMVDHTDDEILDIRRQLAELQTKTVRRLRLLY